MEKIIEDLETNIKSNIEEIKNTLKKSQYSFTTEKDKYCLSDAVWSICYYFEEIINENKQLKHEIEELEGKIEEYQYKTGETDQEETTYEL